MNFVRGKFGHGAVVFDAYEAGSSTKDHEYCRRRVKIEVLLNLYLTKKQK